MNRGGGTTAYRAANAAHLRQHRERAPARATARDVGGVARGGLRQASLKSVDGLAVEVRGAPARGDGRSEPCGGDPSQGVRAGERGPARATRGGGARGGGGSEPRVVQGVGGERRRAAVGGRGPARAR